jgi:hypothetical protein
LQALRSLHYQEPEHYYKPDFEDKPEDSGSSSSDDDGPEFGEDGVNAENERQTGRSAYLSACRLLRPPVKPMNMVLNNVGKDCLHANYVLMEGNAARAFGEMLRGNQFITTLNLANCSFGREPQVKLGASANARSYKSYTKEGARIRVRKPSLHDNVVANASVMKSGDLQEGNTVEARCMGSTKYYAGQVVSASTTLQGAFHIRFDNGGVDREVPRSSIRCLPGGAATHVGGEIIAEALRHNRALESLDLSNNCLKHTALPIARALADNPVLVTLSLHNNGLDQMAAEALARGLRYHPTMRQLDLSSNNLGTRGAECLGQLLLRPQSPQKNKGVHSSVRKGPTRIPRDGGTGASAAGGGRDSLPSCGLTALNLSWNKIKSAGAVVLLHNLALATQMKGKTGAAGLLSLDLSSNGIDDDHLPTVGKHSLCGAWELEADEHSATGPGGSACVEAASAVSRDGDEAGGEQRGVEGAGAGEHGGNRKAMDFNTQYFGRYAWRSSTNPEEHSYRARVPEMLLGVFRYHPAIRRLELAHNKLGRGTEAEYLKAVFHNEHVVGHGEKVAAVAVATAVKEGAGGLFEDADGVGCVCEKGGEAIAAGLLHNSTVRRLGVGFNPLGMAGTMKILKALKKDCNLTVVSLGIENTILESDGTNNAHRHRIEMDPLEKLSYFMNKSRLRMRMVDLLKALDKNRDSKLTRLELEEGIRTVFGQADGALEEEDFVELFEVFDADGNGVVNLKEFKDDNVHGHEYECGDEDDDDEEKRVVVIGGEHQGKEGVLAPDSALKDGDLDPQGAYAVKFDVAQEVGGGNKPSTTGGDGKSEGKSEGPSNVREGGEEVVKLILGPGETVVMGGELNLLQPKKDLGMSLRPPAEQIKAFYKVHKQEGTLDFPFSHTTKPTHYPPSMIPMATCPGGLYCTVDVEEARQAYMVSTNTHGSGSESSEEDDDNEEEGGNGGGGDGSGVGDATGEGETDEERQLQKLITRAKKHCAKQTWTVWGTSKWGADEKFRAGHATAGPAMVGAKIERILADRGVMASITHEYPARERILTDNPVHSCMTQIYKPLPSVGGRGLGARGVMAAGGGISEAAREEEMLRAQWKAEDSIFQSRLLESEDGSLTDTAQMLEDAFEADWKVTVLNSGGLGEIEVYARGSKEIMATEMHLLKEVMKKHYAKVRSIFRHLCGWHATWSKHAGSKLAAVGAFTHAGKRATLSKAGGKPNQNNGGSREPVGLQLKTAPRDNLQLRMNAPSAAARHTHVSSVAEDIKSFLVHYSFVVSLDTFLRFSNSIGVVEHTKYSRAISVNLSIQPTSPSGAAAASPRTGSKGSPKHGATSAKSPKGKSAKSQSTKSPTGSRNKAPGIETQSALEVAEEEVVLGADGGRGVTHGRLRSMFEEANEDPFLLEGNQQDTLERHEFLEIIARLAMARFCRQTPQHRAATPVLRAEPVLESEDDGKTSEKRARNAAGKASPAPAPVSAQSIPAVQAFFSPSNAVEQFMASCLAKVWVEEMDANSFRIEKLYTYDAAKVFEANRVQINRLFAGYATADEDNTVHEFGAQLVMSITEYFEMLMDTGILQDDISDEKNLAGGDGAARNNTHLPRPASTSDVHHGRWLGKHKALRAFLLSSLTVEDEMDSMEYTRLSFIDFLECLGRLADVKYAHANEDAATPTPNTSPKRDLRQKKSGKSSSLPPEMSPFAKALEQLLAEILPAEPTERRGSTGRRISRKFSVSEGLASPLRRASRAR